MDVTDHPLPMVHQYPLPRQALPQLVRSLAQMGTKRLKQVANLSGSRIQTLPGAAALLSATVRKLGASQVVISAWGLRERSAERRGGKECGSTCSYRWWPSH